jgi:hypothetical protein
MHLRTTSLRAALGSPARPLYTAALILALTGGCADTLVPAIKESSQAQEEHGEGARDAREPKCFLSMLYRVEGDLFHFKGGSSAAIPADGSAAGVGGGNGGTNASPGLGMRQELNGYDGFARVLWGDEVVAEFTIDKAFLKSGRVEVLQYEAPDGVRYEYHLYTHPECLDWLPPGVLTRQEVEAREK